MIVLKQNRELVFTDIMNKAKQYGSIGWRAEALAYEVIHIGQKHISAYSDIKKYAEYDIAGASVLCFDRIYGTDLFIECTKLTDSGRSRTINELELYGAFYNLIKEIKDQAFKRLEKNEYIQKYGW